MISKFRSGKFIDQYQYKSFGPNSINRPFDLNDSNINMALVEASRLVGGLDAYSKLVPNVDFFIHMHIFKEATQSSRIEGTKTEFDEAFLEESDIAPEKKDDWQEVQNYTKAMNYAISKLEELPLSMRLLKETHKILLSSVRGKTKQPGEIRKSQNWIGGTNPKNAFFVPPHHEQLPSLLKDLELFWHNDQLEIPELIKVAISHYQFETIHPFLDGNGRIGRLLITLHLIDKGILNRPTLYLSDFFAHNKGSYYEALTVVRHSHNLNHWLIFFLDGVVETTKDSIKTFEKILKIRSTCEEKIIGFGKNAKSGSILLRQMYSNPYIDVNEVMKILKLSHTSANNLINKFIKSNILKEITGLKRNRVFAFESYLKIFR